MGRKLSWDAAVAIANLVSEDTIEAVFRELPEELQLQFSKLANDCESKDWVHIGSSFDIRPRSPLNSNTIELLCRWRSRNREFK